MSYKPPKAHQIPLVKNTAVELLRGGAEEACWPIHLLPTLLCWMQLFLKVSPTQRNSLLGVWLLQRHFCACCSSSWQRWWGTSACADIRSCSDCWGLYFSWHRLLQVFLCCFFVFCGWSCGLGAGSKSRVSPHLQKGCTAVSLNRSHRTKLHKWLKAVWQGRISGPSNLTPTPSDVNDIIEEFGWENNAREICCEKLWTWKCKSFSLCLFCVFILCLAMLYWLPIGNGFFFFLFPVNVFPSCLQKERR